MGPNPRGGLIGLMQRITTSTLDTSALRARYSSPLIDLLDSMLRKLPSHRPLLPALLASPIFATFGLCLPDALESRRSSAQHARRVAHPGPIPRQPAWRGRGRAP